MTLIQIKPSTGTANLKVIARADVAGSREGA